MLQDEMADHKYLINQALNEYCCIYLKARTMTKYKMVQVAVKARKEDRDFRNKGEWTKSVNGIIEDHIKETLAMADEVKEFLGSIKYLVINKEVEDKLQETIEMLEAKGQEVAGMEKSYTTWDEVEATDDKLSEAVYDFNWVCVSAHNESALE